MNDFSPKRITQSRRAYLHWCVIAGIGGVSGCLRLQNADEEGRSDTPVGEESESSLSDDERSTPSTSNSESSSGNSEDNDTDESSVTPSEELNIDLTSTWNVDRFLFNIHSTTNCSIENAVRELDHSVLASFLRLLSANRRTISRNCRYQNRERSGSCVRLTVE